MRVGDARARGQRQRGARRSPGGIPGRDRPPLWVWCDMKLEGNVALITGGGGSMGGAQARLFAREGAAVCVADLFADKAQAVASDVEAAGGRALAVRLDVRLAAEWHAAVATTERAFGPVSILCNNAGAYFRVSFDEQTEE